MNFDNVPLESTSDYFEQVVRISFDILTFNQLTVETEARFNYASISVYSDLVIIPSKLVSLVYKNVNWKEKLIYFLIISKKILHVRKRCR